MQIVVHLKITFFSELLVQVVSVLCAVPSTNMLHLVSLLFFLPFFMSSCGYNARYDSIRLLAEQNTAYIAHFLDNTNDVDPEYQTKVFSAGKSSHGCSCS